MSAHSQHKQHLLLRFSTWFSITQAHAAHADTVASWTNAIDDIDIQMTKVRARREAADLDTSETSDANISKMNVHVEVV